MRNISKFAVLGAALAVSASFAFADTIELASYATTSAALVATAGDSINSATNYNGGNAVTTWVPGTDQTVAAPNQTPSSLANAATYTLTGGSSWTAPISTPLASQYVGYAASNQPGGTNVPQGFYTYTSTFSATGGVYGGSLTILADDTMEVILDAGTANQQILNTFAALGTDSHCADNTPNCTTPVVDALSGITLTAGTNTLTFIDEQAGNEADPDPAGFDYEGVLSQTPEPSSLLLLGTGLVGAAGLLFRRRKLVA